jgi:hypothetical protein
VRDAILVRSHGYDRVPKGYHDDELPHPQGYGRRRHLPVFCTGPGLGLVLEEGDDPGHSRGRLFAPELPQG